MAFFSLDDEMNLKYKKEDNVYLDLIWESNMFAGENMSNKKYVEFESYSTLFSIKEAVDDAGMNDAEKLAKIDSLLFSFETTVKTAKYLDKKE